MINWAEYEKRKGELIKKNLSPAEYELEVQKLVKELQTMGKIIIKQNELEGIAAALASIESQTEGMVSLLMHNRNFQHIEGMCYILQDFSENLTNKLYDLIEKAQELKESEVSNVSDGTSV